MQMERKMRLVTQLDEAAACRLTGYAACTVWFVLCTFSICASHMFNKQLYACGAEWRRCTRLPTCCSTSPRLSDEIRSRARLSPLLPSSSSFALAFCLLAPSFFSSLLQPTSLPFLPRHVLFSFFPSSVFVQHERSAEASACIAPLSDCISSLSILLSLSASPLSAPLSVLISVIRLWGISWD